MNPQAPPPSPKPPGAHVLWLNDRESPAGHLFLTIRKHLVSLNVLHLPHPFFQPLPQRTSPNRGRRGSQGGPPLSSAGMGGAGRQETRPATAGPAPGSGFASHGLWRSLKVDLAVLNHRKLSQGLHMSFRGLAREIGPTHPATVPPT